jgi:hypothetical protein
LKKYVTGKQKAPATSKAGATELKNIKLALDYLISNVQVWVMPFFYITF